MNKKTSKLLVTLILFIFIFYFLPNIVHKYNYSYETEIHEIGGNKKLYRETCNKIFLENNKSEKLLETQDSLYLWFHVRGLKIDEGHEPISSLDKWKELCDYYW